MKYTVAIKSNSNVRRLTKDVPTLRLLIKAEVDKGFKSFTAAYLSGRDRQHSLGLVAEDAEVKGLTLKPYGFDITYCASNQMQDFWAFFKDKCAFVDEVVFKSK